MRSVATLVLLLWCGVAFASQFGLVPAYGELRAYESVATVSINASGYTTYTGWDVNRGLSSGGSVVTTSDSAIWIGPQGGGRYRVSVNMSYQCASSAEVHCDVHPNNVDTGIGYHETFMNGIVFRGSGDVGFLELIPGDSLTVRCIAAADETMLAENASLVAERIAP